MQEFNYLSKSQIELESWSFISVHMSWVTANMQNNLISYHTESVSIMFFQV
jgi:hypothetical protein